MFDMRRRDVLASLGCSAIAVPLLSWPRAAQAQQPDDRVQLLVARILRLQADGIAGRIATFMNGIESQLGWTTQLPWSAGSIEQRRFDALRLLRQVPAVIELAQLDATGKERLRVSRLAMDAAAQGTDHSQDLKFTEAMAKKIYYGPVYFRETGPAERRTMLPAMTLSIAGTRRDAGVSVAEVSLAPIMDLVRATKIGESGAAYVIDAQHRIIAHPDVSLIQRDVSSLAQVQAARTTGGSTAPGSLTLAHDINGREVLPAAALLAQLGWVVLVELPVEELDAAGQ
jgi:Cache domain